MPIYDLYLIHFVKNMDRACNVGEGGEEEERMKKKHFIVLEIILALKSNVTFSFITI